MAREAGTKTRILLEGRSLLQKYGYYGFSFQDIATAIGLKKPSLYEHYGSKEELGLSVLDDYARRFEAWSEEVRSRPAPERIHAMFELFHSFARDGKKFCPVSALAGDLQTLPRTLRKRLQEFAAQWLEWLAEVVREGQETGDFKAELEPLQTSRALMSLGLGVQLLARIQNESGLTVKAGIWINDILRDNDGRRV